MKLKILFSTILVITFTNVICQNIGNPTQYTLNPLSINPAFAGGREALNISSFFQEKWSGINGAPSTFSLSVDAPLFDNTIGLGVMYTKDTYGVTDDDQFYLSYSYRIYWGKSVLSLGLGAGINNTQTRYSDLTVIDAGDDIYLQKSKSYLKPNFRFGIFYSFKDLYFGFSVPEAVNYAFDKINDEYIVDFDFKYYEYLYNIGYVIRVTPNFKVYPSGLVSYMSQRNSSKYYYDARFHLGFFDKVWFGGSYRSERSLGSLIQVQLNNQLSIAYSYDFDIGQLSRYSNGTHGIMLRYVFQHKGDAISPLLF